MDTLHTLFGHFYNWWRKEVPPSEEEVVVAEEEHGYSLCMCAYFFSHVLARTTQDARRRKIHP